MSPLTLFHPLHALVDVCTKFSPPNPLQWIRESTQGSLGKERI